MCSVSISHAGNRNCIILKMFEISIKQQLIKFSLKLSTLAEKQNRILQFFNVKFQITTEFIWLVISETAFKNSI